MKRIINNAIEVLQFEHIQFEGTDHGFLTRKGGISPEPWHSLNQGGTVGDARANVIENRKRAFDFFGRDVNSIFDVWQVHGTNTICTQIRRGLDEPHQKADAIITDNPDVTLFMRFADCVPIMLVDTNNQIIGLIHAGWQGTMKNIVKSAIDAIKKTYGISAKNLIAGIGPSIGPDHYVIGEEVQRAAEAVIGNESNLVLASVNGKLYLDLWKTNQILLQRAGVKTIESAQICTACNLEDWYSHRAERGSTGRFGALIALKK